MKLAYCIQLLLREEGMEKPETLKTVNRLFSFRFVPKRLWTPPAASDTFGCGMLGAA